MKRRGKMNIKKKAKVFYLKKQLSIMLILVLLLTTVLPLNAISSVAESISSTESITAQNQQATPSNGSESFEEEWKSEDFTYDEITEKLISTNSYYAITGFSEKGKAKILKNKALVIPATVEVMEKGNKVEKRITGIGKDAFAKKDIESLTINIPEGYKEYIIADGAFENNKLTEINIPFGVKFIESYAFRDNEIESLDLPETVVKVGNNSFTNNKISSLTVSDRVEKFQFDSFSFANNKLTEVHLPYSIFKLLKNVFINNTGYQDGKVLLYTRNKKHLETSTYIQPHSDYHEFRLMGEEVNRENLYKLIKTAAALELSDYTQESRDVLVEKLNAAQVAFAGEASTQEEINAAEVNLKQAIEALVPEGVNKRKLNENIKRIEERNPSALLYTAESYAALTSALNEAKRVFADASVSQEEVNLALSALLNSENALTIKEEAKYTLQDFTFEGSKITGFSASGKDKFEYNKDLLIPEINADGEAITEIADSAFENTKSDYIIRTDTGYSPSGLDSVVIPETVKRIGAKAFKYNKIKEVKLPDGLEYIGSLAFNGNQLTGIEIPDSVTDMGEGVFSLNRIAHAKLSNGMEKIAPGIFARNITLGHIDIPQGTKVIGKSAFSGCPIREINIPEGVERIEETAFLSHRIETLYLPPSVKIVEKQAFASNKKFRYLKYIKLSEGIEEIGSNAFKSGLVEEVDIPLSLKKLAKDAFNDNFNSEKDVIKTKVYSVSNEQIELLKNKANKHELILKTIDLTKLKNLIDSANNLKNSYKYQNAAEEKKTDFDKALLEALRVKNEPISQSNVNNHVDSLQRGIDNLDGSLAKEDKGKEEEKPDSQGKEPDKKEDGSKQDNKQDAKADDKQGGKVDDNKTADGNKTTDVNNITDNNKTVDDNKITDNNNQNTDNPNKKDDNKQGNNNTVNDSKNNNQNADQNQSNKAYQSYSYSSSGSGSSGSFGGSSKVMKSVKKKEKEGSWQRDAKGWWYKHKDSSYSKASWELIDGKWYYFNEEGYMFSGWLIKDGVWYYLATFGETEGSMLKGWQSINSKWYYFNESGAMLLNTSVSGYRLGADGAYIE